MAKPKSPPKPLNDEPEAHPSPKRESKIGALVGLLRRPGGATTEVLQAATGWQAHSVRGAIAGAIKKKLGLEVASEKAPGGRVYRIAEPPAE